VNYPKNTPVMTNRHPLFVGGGITGGFHRISFKSNNLEILLLTQVKGWGYYRMKSPNNLDKCNGEKLNL